MPRTVWIVGLLVAGGLVLSPFLGWLRDLAGTAVVPAEGLGKATRSSRSFLGTIGEIRQLRQRVAELEQETTRLQGQLISQAELLEATKQLTAERALVPADLGTADLVAARVVGWAPTRLLEEVTINVGKQDDVDVGQAVIARGFLVGRIGRVASSRATVTLITSSTSLIPVIVQEGRAQGLLRGGLDGLIVGDLPITADLIEGAGVVTSALGEVVPPGIPVGMLAGTVSAESEILQRASLRSPISLAELEQVSVVRRSRAQEAP